MGFFSWLRKRVKRLTAAVSKALAFLLGKEARDAYADFVAATLKTAFGQMALEVVANLSYQNLTNSQRRKEALRRIIAAAAELGEPIPERLARALLEAALERVKQIAEADES